MGWFRAFLIFDVLALLVLLFFFVDGLRYAPSGDYFGAWLPLLAIPIVGIGLALLLKAKGKIGWAVAVVALLASPALLYLLFVGLLIILQPSWN